MNKIVDIKEYKRNYQKKMGVDSGEIELSDLSLEELDGVGELYQKEINWLLADIQKQEKEIADLKQKNARLKELLGLET